MIAIYPSGHALTDSPLAPGMRVGEFLFVSGQVPRKEDGNWAERDIKAQTECVLSNLLKVVEAAGGGLRDIIKVNCYLTDPSNFSEFNEAYRAFFGEEPYPARTTVAVTLMRPEMLVEVEAMVMISGACE